MKEEKAGGVSYLTLEQFLGLNESPDGEGAIDPREAAVMENFRLTRERHIALRRGTRTRCDLRAEAERVLGESLPADTPVRALWSGYAASQPVFAALCGGVIFLLDEGGENPKPVGRTKSRTAPGHFFGFGEKLYLLTGEEYLVWDGEGEFSPVEGYIPLVAGYGAGSGEGAAMLERVNLLTGKRRQLFSPREGETVFHLCEQKIDEVISVTGTEEGYEADLAEGTVTFQNPIPAGTGTVEITWRKGEGDRSVVEHMHFSETYNGAQDARVFLYGDGTNRAIYSDLDENGKPSAEYFPDLNMIHVDAANTCITGMIRHYDDLLTFKEDGAFCTRYDAVTLEDGRVTAGFFTSPLNREVGNLCPGGVRLIENDPRTLNRSGIWDWTVLSGGSRDERNARRISGRVHESVSALPIESVLPFDDPVEGEYYLFGPGGGLVHHYGVDGWYKISGLSVTAAARTPGGLWFGTGEGRLLEVSEHLSSDDGAAIPARYESGCMTIGSQWRRRRAGTLFLTLKPQANARLTVSAETEREGNPPHALVAVGLAGFGATDFRHYSFGTSRKPRPRRVPLKLRRFSVVKLVFTSEDSTAAPTVTACTLRSAAQGEIR